MRLMFVLWLVVFSFDAMAEQCIVLETSKSGMKKIQVEGTDFFALTRDQMVQCSKLKKQADSGNEDKILESLIEETKSKDKLILDLQAQLQAQTIQIGIDTQFIEKQAATIAKFESLNTKYQTTLNKSIKLTEDFEKTGTSLANLNKKYEEHVQSWADHAQECRELASNAASGIIFDLGVGMTKGTATGGSKAAGLVGVGFQNIKVWSFIQKGNSGALLGVSKAF